MTNWASRRAASVAPLELEEEQAQSEQAGVWFTLCIIRQGVHRGQRHQQDHKAAACDPIGAPGFNSPPQD